MLIRLLLLSALAFLAYVCAEQRRVIDETLLQQKFCTESLIQRTPEVLQHKCRVRVEEQ